MSARLRREARNLGPLLLTGCALLGASLLLPGEMRPEVMTVLFVLGCAVIGVATFGLEFVHGTCPQLMGLPMPREVVWRDKLIVQAGALVFLVAAFGLSVDAQAYPFRLRLGGVMFGAPLVALAGGSLLVLYLRNVVGAFILLLGWGTVIYFVFDEGAIGALVPVAVLGQCWFRKRLLRFENYSRWSEEVNLSPGLSAGTRVAAVQPAGIWWTLIRKELCLQQITLVVVALGFGLPLLLMCLGFGFHSLFTSFEVRWLFGFKVFGVYIGTFLLIGIPVLVGTAAVIEERRKEVYRWQAVLPPGRSCQWFIKLAVAVVMATSLGLTIMFTVAADVFSPRDIELTMSEKLWIYPAYATATVLLSMLIATTVQEYFTAIAAAALMVTGIIILFFFGVVVVGMVFGVMSWPLLCVFLVPLVTAFAVEQGRRNHASVEPAKRLLTQTMSGIASRMGLAILLTCLIYHRTWEWIESPYQARAAKLFDTAKMQAFVGDLGKGQSLDPQGRLWRVEWPSQPTTPTFSQIGTDSDWVQVAHALDYGFAALKADGTLWMEATDRGLQVKFPTEFAAVTPHHRWKQVDFDGSRILGLKDDGTLWFWGSEFMVMGHNRQSRVEPEPVRIGTDSDWSDLIVSGYSRQSLALRQNGNVYGWGRFMTEHGAKMRWELGRHPSFTGVKVKEARVIRMAIVARLDDGRIVTDRGHWYASQVASKIPGTGLWLLNPDVTWEGLGHFDGFCTAAITRDQRWVNNGSDSLRYYQALTPLWWNAVDFETDWAAVGAQSYSRESIAMKQDGSLWFTGPGPLDWEERRHMIIPPRFRPQLIGQMPIQFFEPERKAAQ